MDDDEIFYSNFNWYELIKNPGFFLKISNHFIALHFT